VRTGVVVGEVNRDRKVALFRVELVAVQALALDRALESFDLGLSRPQLARRRGRASGPGRQQAHGRSVGRI
jgi:hypothetical protein